MTYAPCRFYPKKSKRLLFFAWVCALISVGLGTTLLRGWDCDDYALATYQAATFLHLDCTIKYANAHVWVAVQGVDINGFGSYREATIEELKAWVERDK